jgi:hypothetical protein
MSDAQFIMQGDKQVLLIDLSGISDYRVVPDLVGKAIRLAQSGQIPGSIRTLVDLSGTSVNGRIISSLKDLSRNNGRYAKATAFVGLHKGWSMLLTMMFRMRGKTNHKVLSSRSEALRWLEQW